MRTRSVTLASLILTPALLARLLENLVFLRTPEEVIQETFDVAGSTEVKVVEITGMDSGGVNKTVTVKAKNIGNTNPDALDCSFDVQLISSGTVRKQKLIAPGEPIAYVRIASVNLVTFRCSHQFSQDMRCKGTYEIKVFSG